MVNCRLKEMQKRPGVNACSVLSHVKLLQWRPEHRGFNTQSFNVSCSHTQKRSPNKMGMGWSGRAAGFSDPGP